MQHHVMVRPHGEEAAVLARLSALDRFLPLWIALAMVIFAGWSTRWIVLGAWLFGGLVAMQFRAQAFGIDPVHFGVIMILNCGIGLITPPVGSVLFVGSAIGGIPMTQALKSIWPFYLACVAVLILVVFIPELSLWLPSLLK
jgi:TRAP-type C4-dicarboxylate transport system permease large subunit